MKRALSFLLAAAASAQVWSPRVLRQGQPDHTDLARFARGIYAQAGAHTPRQRAEAIWRFFLTDGRFVPPGFWYHIAGWAYEEPGGEVLDPLKLLNSYGFGLCYQVAPLLASVWKAGGFEDARVWFLNGHTVAEVWYEGAYHHYDSDLMGYPTLGNGPAKSSTVASVRQLERDKTILLGKLLDPRHADPARIDPPYYPGDIQEAALGDIAELFSTAPDNRLFAFERSPQGHSMDFVLRPGERLVRYYRPERDDLFYLPFKNTGETWEEFPRDVPQYKIFTRDGPHSQRDARRWATGRLEYRPPSVAPAGGTWSVQSPWVIIDAAFDFDLEAPTAASAVTVETSADGGRTWVQTGRLQGPRSGRWSAEPAVLARSANGRRNAVAGAYAYLLRATAAGGARLQGVTIATRFQHNPRTLPELGPGRNPIVYAAGPNTLRETIQPEPVSRANARWVSSGGQGFWVPDGPGPAEFLFRLSARGGEPLTAFSAGARFLDLSAGEAPDKFTAEVRRVPPVPSANAAASIEWSTTGSGPFQPIWTYDPRLRWKDGDAIDRLLRWPEIDRRIPLQGPREVYIRIRAARIAVDQFRLAVESAGAGSSGLKITHQWRQDGTNRSLTRRLNPGTTAGSYSIDIPSAARVEPEALILDCPAPKSR
jgi:hypothetical protein